MLTPEEVREIEAEMKAYPTKEAVGLGALRTIQRRRGWISDQALRDVADYLGMSADELDGAATFYPLLFRRPIGRHVIRICDSVSCWVMGYEAAYRRLTEALGIRLGETTADGRFTLLPTSCLGVCDHAPALMIDDDVHGDWSLETMDDILARYP
jgi:NADH-quinone oxidoreductase subunit E